MLFCYSNTDALIRGGEMDVGASERMSKPDPDSIDWSRGCPDASVFTTDGAPAWASSLDLLSAVNTQPSPLLLIHSSGYSF